MTQINHPETLRLIRARLAERVMSSGLRAVAREVGMSPSGLRQLIEGTAPYRPTLHKLLVWWVRQPKGQDEPGEEILKLGIEMTTRRVPAHLVQRTAALLMELLENVTQDRLVAMEAALKLKVPPGK